MVAYWYEGNLCSPDNVQSDYQFSEKFMCNVFCLYACNIFTKRHSYNYISAQKGGMISSWLHFH